MVKNVLKRFLAMMLAVMMVLSLLPAMSLSVEAAVNGLDVNGLSVDNNGGKAAASGTSIDFSASGTAGTCSSSAGKGTLTLTNNREDEALLSFDYTVTLNGGSVTIDGEKKTANGKFNKKIASNDSIQIAIETQAGDYTTSVRITNVALVLDRQTTTAFEVSENGSYTVDGVAVTESTSYTKQSTEAYALVAKANSGYKFFGWLNKTTGKYISSNATASVMFDTTNTLTAVFVSQSTPVFETAGSLFTDLNEAVAYAQSQKAEKITLVSDGILTEGNYDIPNGITLLIPFDDAGTTYTTTPGNVSTSYVTPSAFRTLTMASGATVTVEGAISVSAKHAAAGGGSNYGGSPSGKVGFIKMESGSNITINNGGSFYVWGFVTGNGTVTANSGATVYENFQIADFRGGSATFGLAGGPVFPFSQYYVQNIEVPVTFHSDANEILYTSLYAGSSVNSTSVEFIGSSGMFRPSGSITKTYDGSSDRLIFDLDGNAELNSISVNVGGAGLNSANFNLPINNNISINVHSGVTNINQNVALQPGAEVSVDEGATLKVADSKKVYAYDSDNWGNYANTTTFKAVHYAPSRTYNRSNSDLKDVVVDINGTVDADGYLYTTEGGADITSSNGTGKIVLNKGAGTDTTTQQATQSGSSSSKVNVNITSAKLHNAVEDPEYTETADAKAGDTYYYNSAKGMWTNEEPVNVAVNFDKNAADATGEMAALTVSIEGEEEAEATLTQNAFERTGYTFAGWNTAADGTGTAYEDGATITLASDAEDVTLYAQWTPIQLTVSFDASGGSGDMEAQTVDYNVSTKLNSNAFTREGYEFTGWNTAADGTGTAYSDPAEVTLTEDLTLFAQWQIKTYTVTWTNEDGTVLETDENVEYGTEPSFDGENPTKADTDEFTYTFNGWDPEISAVTGDVTYKAEFSSERNTYTVTWKDYDGSVLAESDVAYGDVPGYPKDVLPTREEDAEFTYTFSGWTPEISAVTGDAEYTAQYSTTTNNYTITWVNEDGFVLQKNEDVPYGSDVPAYEGATPTKASTEQYEYEFAGWTSEGDVVEGNMTFTATYDSILRKYTITWKNGDETLKSEEVAYGETPAYSGDAPARENTAQYSYEFTGWAPEISEVTGDATYSAQFEETLRSYTVTWKAADGTVLESDENVEYGTTPSFDGDEPTMENDEQYSYEFAGWSPEVSVVESDITYTAQFTQTVNTYKVTWVNDDDTVLNEEDVEYGKKPSYSGETPAKEAEGKTYTFTGWNPEITDETVVTEDVTYKAVYEEETNKYTIYWQTWDNTILEKQEVEYGETPSYGGATPSRPQSGWYTYTFTGWAPEIVAATGDATYSATFDQVGMNGWQTDDNGTTYVEDGEQIYTDAWAEIDGKTYYFDTEGYLVSGLHTVKTQDGSGTAMFLFNEDGVFASDYTGIYRDGEDTYWIDNGVVATYAGLKRVEEDNEIHYYYFGEDNKAVKNVPEGGADQWISKEKTNGYLVEWGYYIAEDGVLLHDDTSWNGIHEKDGTLYYYIDGVRVSLGMFKEGNDYYYAKSGGRLVVGTSYYCTKTNGLMKEGSYTFDDSGKLILPEDPDTSKNGIVAENGSLYYYVDGVITYAGLIEIDGSYYYVKTSGEVVHGRNYWITKTNGFMDEASYTFADDGKMVVPEVVKDGIVEENGSLYYYENGTLTYAGLIEIDGDYYYVKTSCEVIHGRSYWISKTNGLVKEGSYEFDDSGMMINPPAKADDTKAGIVEENGSLYYYVDGVLNYAGLIEIDGDYYYVKSSGEVIHGKKYWISKTNGLMKEGSYIFDDDGKLIK